MQKIIELIGLGDGSGNTSSSRVVLYLIVLAILVPKVVLAIQTKTPPTWTQDDILLIGAAFGGKLVNSAIENKAPVSTATT